LSPFYKGTQNMTQKHAKESKNRGCQVNSPKIKIGDVPMSKLKKDLAEQRKLYTISSKSPDEKVRLLRAKNAIEQELLKRNAPHHIEELLGLVILDKFVKLAVRALSERRIWKIKSRNTNGVTVPHLSTLS